jgi:hypothetical protein
VPNSELVAADYVVPANSVLSLSLSLSLFTTTRASNSSHQLCLLLPNSTSNSPSSPQQVTHSTSGVTFRSNPRFLVVLSVPQSTSIHLNPSHPYRAHRHSSPNQTLFQTLRSRRSSQASRVRDREAHEQKKVMECSEFVYKSTAIFGLHFQSSSTNYFVRQALAIESNQDSDVALPNCRDSFISLCFRVRSSQGLVLLRYSDCLHFADQILSFVLHLSLFHSVRFLQTRSISTHSQLTQFLFALLFVVRRRSGKQLVRRPILFVRSE